MEKGRIILKDNPLDLVEVYCPLEICRERNIARGDRSERQVNDESGCGVFRQPLSSFIRGPVE